MPLRGRTQRTRTVPTIDEDAPLEHRGSKPRTGSRKLVSFNDHKITLTNRQQEGPKISRRVHWNHRVEKKRHHRLQDLTEEEKEAVWYTEADTKIILAMAKVTVKMMMRGEPCDDVDYCCRGLEGKTSAGSKKRQKNKLRVRKALLGEQEYQRGEGVSDPENLAQISIENSRDVVAHAHNIAVMDERNVQEYLYGTHGDYIPMPPRRIKRA